MHVFFLCYRGEEQYVRVVFFLKGYLEQDVSIWLLWLVLSRLQVRERPTEWGLVSIVQSRATCQRKATPMRSSRGLAEFIVCYKDPTETRRVACMLGLRLEFGGHSTDFLRVPQSKSMTYKLHLEICISCFHIYRS